MQYDNRAIGPQTRAAGRVQWSRFLPWSLGAICFAAALAGVLHWLFISGWYLVMLAPILAALAMSGVIHLAVAFGHCRQRLLAAALGLVAGAVLYLGQFQIDMAHQFGPQFAWRVDLLPRYIAFRKTIEKQEDLGPNFKPQPAINNNAQPAANNNPQLIANRVRKSEVVKNWVFFALEFGFVLFATCLSGYCAAGRPYCDRCQKWMRRQAVFFLPGIGAEIVRAVEENRLHSLAALQALPPPKKGAYTAVVAAWCEPPQCGAIDCQARLSVKAVRRGGGPSLYSQIDAAFGRTLLAERPLSREQVVQLQPRFPALKALTRGETQRQEQAKEEALARNAGAEAEVRPVAAAEAGQILSQRMVLIGNLISLVPLLMLAGGLVAALIGYFAFKAPANPTGTAIAAAGIGAMFLGFRGMRDVGWLSRKLLLRRAGSVISLRAEAWVRPDDPEAIFMQLVPRERWGKLMLDTASDVGFVKLDSRRRQILFEGDRERYRIPGEAILGCRVEKIVYGPASDHETCVFLCVLRARGPQGVFEAPLGRRDTLNPTTIPARQAWAEEFCQRVLSLAPQGAAAS